MSNPWWSEAEPGHGIPPKQSLGKATHESAPAMRLKNKGKALAYVFSFAAVCQHFDSVAPRALALWGGATPGSA